MVDLTNELYTKIKAAIMALYPTAKVDKQYQATTTVFPYITILDVDNTEISHDLSYTGKQSKASWQIDIYMNGGLGEITAKKIRDAIVPIFENQYHMNRSASRPVTNTADTTIYRYMLRYDCKIDEDRNVIYG